MRINNEFAVSPTSQNEIYEITILKRIPVKTEGVLISKSAKFFAVEVYGRKANIKIVSKSDIVTAVGNIGEKVTILSYEHVIIDKYKGTVSYDRNGDLTVNTSEGKAYINFDNAEVEILSTGTFSDDGVSELEDTVYEEPETEDNQNEESNLSNVEEGEKTLKSAIDDLDSLLEIDGDIEDEL